MIVSTHYYCGLPTEQQDALEEVAQATVQAVKHTGQTRGRGGPVHEWDFKHPMMLPLRRAVKQLEE